MAANATGTSGDTAATDWDESVRFDLYYAENWSVMSDLMILWRTGRAVLRSSGAY